MLKAVFGFNSSTKGLSFSKMMIVDIPSPIQSSLSLLYVVIVRFLRLKIRWGRCLKLNVAFYLIKIQSSSFEFDQKLKISTKGKESDLNGCFNVPSSNTDKDSESTK